MVPGIDFRRGSFLCEPGKHGEQFTPSQVPFWLEHPKATSKHKPGIGGRAYCRCIPHAGGHIIKGRCFCVISFPAFIVHHRQHQGGKISPCDGSTGSTVADCESNYRLMLARNGLIDQSDTEITPSGQSQVTGAIAEIRSAVVEGRRIFRVPA